MFLFTKSDVDTVLKVKKWEPTLYTVSQDNDCFEALNIELRTTPDIQKVSIEDEEKDNIYISVEEKIQIL